MEQKTNNLKDYWKHFNNHTTEPQVMCLELCEPTCLSLEWLEENCAKLDRTASVV